ncbi:MAG: sigma-70 family RNA polymerase sigma factor [Acidobacteriota bacterium]
MSLDQRGVTELLDAWSEGDPNAAEKLLPLVIDDLRRIARSHLAREKAGHTLEPTALVNELYLRLAGRRSVHWQSRTQFFASMAEIMRHILVDHARRRKTLKKGGDAVPQSLDEGLEGGTLWGPAIRAIDIDLVALHGALEDLAVLDARQARIVELRYFGGLTIEETARTLGSSPTTVKREWHTARLWLLRELSRGAGEAAGPS